MLKKIFIAGMMMCILAMPCASAEEAGTQSEDYEPLYTLAEKYGFRLGGCFSPGELKDESYMAFLARHFNSLTCTNETKAYSLLNQDMSKLSPDGKPMMNYYWADQMVGFAKDHGIGIRGHVLVWDAYMTDWFFREGYDSAKPYADRETVRQRIASYIDQVMTHFETKFPGVIYCWDVVNEAIGDSAADSDLSTPRHIRNLRGGENNLFLELAGDDYVEYAFLCARNTAEKLGVDIRLFYNDYNMFQTGKRAAACALIESINHYAQDKQGNDRKLIDGIGMQGYIGGYGQQPGCMNSADIAAIRKSIELYASHGMEVQITEMAVRNYDKSQAASHAEFYGKLFEMFKQVNNEDSNPLTAVCIWGINDCPSLPKTHYTWKLNSPYGGLLTEDHQIKTSFDTVYHVLKGE